MLSIVNNGLNFKDGGLRYAFFEIEKDGRRFFRCVALKELLTIPASEKEDYDLLSKHHVAMRGLHNAGINFVYAAMGIYDPDHVGIVQYFGAAGEGETEEDAAKIALVGAATVEAVLANFPQTKLGVAEQGLASVVSRLHHQARQKHCRRSRTSRSAFRAHGTFQRRDHRRRLGYRSLTGTERNPVPRSFQASTEFCISGFGRT